MSKRKTKLKSEGKSVLVAVVMGSDSDFSVMKSAGDALRLFDISFEMKILSAHRTPKEMLGFAEKAHLRGIRVIIAGAGGAAHLPGMIASLTPLPVIGVPVVATDLKGLDSLLSVVQMPKGVPVASVAVNNAFNAGLLAAQMISAADEVRRAKLIRGLLKYKDQLRRMVLAKKLSIHRPKGRSI